MHATLGVERRLSHRVFPYVRTPERWHPWVMDSAVVGRDAELASLRDLLEAAEDGPAALLIEGDAGIGKTTLWNAGLEAARRAGLRALVCRGAATEVKLGYAALTDLLAEVGGEEIDDLPAPQRAALGAALLRIEPADAAPPDPRAVGTALLTLLERLADAGPVLVAIDELQWLDQSSARAMRFAARRLRGRVAVLAARRIPPWPPAEEELRLRDSERLRLLRLGPLGREQIHRLLRERTGGTFPPPTLARIDRVAAGNPFVALEIARALKRNGRSGAPTFPESLRELVAARLSGLEPDVLKALLLAAATSRPRVVTIQRALEEGDADELLGVAEEAGIAAIAGGEIAFTHPLLAGGVYAAATNTGRRAAHRRLAAVVEGAEERARHLALASVAADPEVITALDAAADEARRRGAPADAAELLSLALGLGAEEPSRLLAAAESHFAAGDLAQAQALAERAVGAFDAGPERARALGLLGTIRHRDDSYQEASALLEQALAEAGTGSSRVTLALTLAYVLANSGRLREAPPHAAAAVAEAEWLGEPGLLAEALAVRTMVGFLLGQGFDEPALERALELEDPARPTPIVLTPTLIATYIWGCTGNFAQALAALDTCCRRCLEHGAEVELIQMTASTVTIPCEAGELERARELVEDASERALQLGTPAARAIALGSEATLAGWTGDADTARRCARESLALFESIGVTGQAFMTTHALGRLELSLGAYEAAAGLLVPPLDGPLARGDGEPAAPPFAPDAIEALLALGRLEDARPLVRWLSERAEALGRPQLEALAARGRGLLLAAEGDLEGAEKALVVALDAHEAQPIPYERARTLLACGQIQRRRRRRRAARESLEEASQIFQQTRRLALGPRAARRSSAGLVSDAAPARRANTVRAARRAARRTRPNQPPGRRHPVHQPEDGRGQSLPRLPQAQDPLACRARPQNGGEPLHR